MDYCLYTFSSSSQAMKAEMLLQEAKIKARLVPLLPEIDAGCGLALRFSIEDYKEVDKIFSEKNFAYENRYVLTYVEGKRKPEVKNYDLS
ncbi:MAG: DUF3343 domain-containing protein [Bacillota bacterium]|nr:DUF3343 domain-containing protein [Bacillota bacterium]